MLQQFAVLRYDLGSGPAVLKSSEKVKMNQYHRLTAKRRDRNGILWIDDGLKVLGVSPGVLRSLDLETSLYLGHLPNATETYVTLSCQSLHVF